MTFSEIKKKAQGITFLLLAPWLLLNPASADPDYRIVKIATTTSTENSGLTRYLLPEVEKDTGFQYQTIAAGTGKALQIGRAGDVDVVMVHAKSSELEFVKQGYGVDRTEFMYNDFVIVGPSRAEGGIDFSGMSSVVEIFQNIQDNQVLFVSRGDDSGTHKKELQIWAMAGTLPDGIWYREVGQGMGKTLQIAGELGAYTLTDRGTWLFTQERSSLEIVFEGDPELFNQYSVMAVNPDRHDINYPGAKALIAWLSGDKGQRMINEFRIDGEQLFNANARAGN
ncbi:MAG: tungsten ABC transporter substrate-binding protein [Gammaproteobacteria bacterium]|nr:tungsten ABC transporter substrate-binding protein [Gammaproteobacteria bacterium]